MFLFIYSFRTFTLHDFTNHPPNQLPHKPSINPHSFTHCINLTNPLNSSRLTTHSTTTINTSHSPAYIQLTSQTRLLLPQLIHHFHLISPTKTHMQLIPPHAQSPSPTRPVMVLHNSDLLAGYMDKANLGSGSKSNVFFAILKCFGEDEAAAALSRLTRISTHFMSWWWGGGGL